VGNAEKNAHHKNVRLNIACNDDYKCLYSRFKLIKLNATKGCTAFAYLNKIKKLLGIKVRPFLLQNPALHPPELNIKTDQINCKYTATIKRLPSSLSSSSLTSSLSSAA